MQLRAPPNTVLLINKHVVHTVLGVPTGTRPPPKVSYNDVNAERARLAESLGSLPGKITISRLKDKLREHKIYYLDNLMHKENWGNRMITPRAALFTGKKVATLELADRLRDHQGIIHYGRLPMTFRSDWFSIHARSPRTVQHMSSITPFSSAADERVTKGIHWEDHRE
ncbi:unnamed protein product [Urochloa humidicola]